MTRGETKRAHRSRLIAAALAAGLGAAAVTLPPAPHALAAEATQTARPEIGKPVEEAQRLIKQKRYAEALAKLRQAEAVPQPTPYEVYVIAETRGAADLALRDYADAIKALEAGLASGMLPPSERLKRVETLAQLSYQTKDHRRLADYAERYYHEGGTDPEPRLLLAQAYYDDSDFADAAKTVRALLQAEESAGKPPREDLLLLLLNSEYRQKNEAGYIDALERLVERYPKKAYWTDLLAAIAGRPGFSPQLTLDLDRLALATDSIAKPQDYVAAAELALAQDLPGDAKSFLDRGYATGALGTGAEAAREKRLAEMAGRAAAEGLDALPSRAKEAQAAAAGEPWIKLGDAYASERQYDNAAAAFEQGLAKGGVDHAETAKLHLGVAYLHAGRKDRAKAVLTSVAGTDGSRDLARLWLIAGGIDR